MGDDYGENEYAKEVDDGVCRIAVGDVLATGSDLSSRWCTAHLLVSNS